MSAYKAGPIVRYGNKAYGREGRIRTCEKFYLTRFQGETATGLRSYFPKSLKNKKPARWTSDGLINSKAEKLLLYSIAYAYRFPVSYRRSLGKPKLRMC